MSKRSLERSFWAYLWLHVTFTSTHAQKWFRHYTLGVKGIECNETLFDLLFYHFGVSWLKRLWLSVLFCPTTFWRVSSLLSDALCASTIHWCTRQWHCWWCLLVYSALHSVYSLTHRICHFGVFLGSSSRISLSTKAHWCSIEHWEWLHYLSQMTTLVMMLSLIVDLLILQTCPHS